MLLHRHSARGCYTLAVRKLYTAGWIVPTGWEIIRHISSTTGKAGRFIFVIDECCLWGRTQIGVTVGRMNEFFDMNTSEPV